MKISILLRIPNLVFVLMLVLSTSCIPQKKLVYLQGTEYLKDNPQKVEGNYELTIQPDDQLSIAISSKDKELIEPFNTKAYIGMGSGSQTSMSTQSNLAYFQVDNKGMIDFPILGQILVEGKTRHEVQKEIENMLITGNHIKDPQVTVKIMSFKVSVLGEVASPGVQEITGERLTVLEAISLAGDLLPTAKRKNVLVLREENGLRKTYSLDLTSGYDVLNSPAYYLQQNDVVYVEPNKSLGIKGSSTLNTITSIGGILAIILSVASIIISASN